jgi:hypothetical protein
VRSNQIRAKKKPESARPTKIMDQSPTSRPQKRPVTAKGSAPVATPDFSKATGTVCRTPIFIPLFPNPRTLRGRRGFFQSELCSAFESDGMLQSGHMRRQLGEASVAPARFCVERDEACILALGDQATRNAVPVRKWLPHDDPSSLHQRIRSRGSSPAKMEIRASRS